MGGAGEWVKLEETVREPRTNLLGHFAGEEYMGKVSDRVAGAVVAAVGGGIGNHFAYSSFAGEEAMNKFPGKGCSIAI